MNFKRSLRGVIGAQVFEALAAGLMMSMAIVYFATITNVPLAQIGLASAAAALVSMPLGVLGGWLQHRYGSRTALIVNNLLTAAGYSIFLFANSALLIFFAILLTEMGGRIYWAIWTTFMKDLAGDSPYEATFAKFESIKMAIMGCGAAMSVVVLAIASTTGVRWIVFGNVVFTLIAAVIYSTIKIPVGTHVSEEIDIEAAPIYSTIKIPVGTHVSDDIDMEAAPAVRWKAVNHRGFWPILIGQFFLAPIMVLPNVALSAYFVTVWGLSPAVASVTFGVNAAVVAIFQQLVTKAVRFVPRSTLINTACLILIGCLVALALTPPLEGLAAWTFVVAVAIMLGVGDILYMPATNALMAEVPPPEVRGLSVSIFQTGMAVGMALYPATLVLLDINPLLIWAVTGASIGIGAIAYNLATVRGPAIARVSVTRGS